MLLNSVKKFQLIFQSFEKSGLKVFDSIFVLHFFLKSLNTSNEKYIFAREVIISSVLLYILSWTRC